MMFQRIRAVAGAVLLSAVLVASIVPAAIYADDANLIGNAGFEETVTGDPATPAGWYTDSWGSNNAALSYVTDAHAGGKAVRTDISNYQDGDAKWLFNPLAVAGGDSYDYSDWYKANASTNLWAQFVMQDGTRQYRFLKVVPESVQDWTQVNATIAAPEGAMQLSVFHVLAANGWLEIDDVSLVHQTVCTPSYINGLANGDFEETCPGSNGMPAGWQAVQYGGSAASFSYTDVSYHGDHAVAVTNADNGAEAGFMTRIQSPAAGQRYALSFEQMGDTYAYAYLAFNLNDGSTQYQSLMSVPLTGGSWSQYTDSFVTPATTRSFDLTIATSGAGTLNLDNVILDPLPDQSPTSFTAGMLSLTFDDGDASTYTKGFPALKQYGYKGTFYLNADTIDAPGYMTSKQVRALAANGQEIGSHLYHHSDMVQIGDLVLHSELSGNIESLQQILDSPYAIKSFASPYGSYTSGKIDTVMQYEESHRTTDGLMNTKANLNPRQIHAKLITPATSLADVKSWVASAQQSHAWLVLVYHGISTSTASDGDGEAGYNVTPTNFKKQLSAIKASAITVLPVADALAELQNQL